MATNLPDIPDNRVIDDSSGSLGYLGLLLGYADDDARQAISPWPRMQDRDRFIAVWNAWESMQHPSNLGRFQSDMFDYKSFDLNLYEEEVPGPGYQFVKLLATLLDLGHTREEYATMMHVSLGVPVQQSGPIGNTSDKLIDTPENDNTCSQHNTRLRGIYGRAAQRVLDIWAEVVQKKTDSSVLQNLWDTAPGDIDFVSTNAVERNVFAPLCRLLVAQITIQTPERWRMAVANSLKHLLPDVPVPLVVTVDRQRLADWILLKDRATRLLNNRLPLVIEPADEPEPSDLEPGLTPPLPRSHARTTPKARKSKGGRQPQPERRTIPALRDVYALCLTIMIYSHILKTYTFYWHLNFNNYSDTRILKYLRACRYMGELIMQAQL